MIVFDFDGTIADSIDLIINIIKQRATDYGSAKIDDALVQNIRGRDVREVMRSLDIPLRKLPFFARRARHDMEQAIGSVNLVAGIDTVIQELRQSGKTLGVVTSNSEKNVEQFLLRHGLPPMDFIYSVGLFNKSRVFNRVMRTLKVPASKLLYIGDETRDVRAARAVSVDIAAVTWGFNSRDILTEYQPTYIADKPEDLLAFIG